MASKPGDHRIPGDKGARMRALSQGAACVLPWRCPV
jgi:hypothetical protein